MNLPMAGKAARITKNTKLPFSEFMKRLDVLMDSLYFQNDNQYCKRINGLPIGLSVSPNILSCSTCLLYFKKRTLY